MSERVFGVNKVLVLQFSNTCKTSTNMYITRDSIEHFNIPFNIKVNWVNRLNVFEGVIHWYRYVYISIHGVKTTGFCWKSYYHHAMGDPIDIIEHGSTLKELFGKLENKINTKLEIMSREVLKDLEYTSVIIPLRPEYYGTDFDPHKVFATTEPAANQDTEEDENDK